METRDLLDNIESNEVRTGDWDGNYRITPRLTKLSCKYINVSPPQGAFTSSLKISRFESLIFFIFKFFKMYLLNIVFLVFIFQDMP